MSGSTLFDGVAGAVIGASDASEPLDGDVVLAADTGDALATVDHHGDAPALLAGDIDGYVVVERTGDGSLALARYPYPD